MTDPRIITLTGKLVDPLDLKPADIDIEDIAHALSNLCRFTGHCPKFYSVAQHSCFVASLVPRELRLAALLHDASEAYLSDIASPTKQRNTMVGYRMMEHFCTKAIAEKFGVSRFMLESVKPFDAAAYRDEFTTFWPGASSYIPAVPVVPVSSAVAKAEFLVAFEDYSRG